MQAEFEQTLSNNIKLFDNKILSVLNKNGVVKMSYRKVSEQRDDNDKKEVFIIFLAAGLEDRTTVTLTKFKNGFLKFRTPNVLRPHVGKTIRVYHDMITNFEGELFRIEGVDFCFGEDESFNVKYTNPYITKSGIVVIPKLYIDRKSVV